jgi:hypothetical protein
MSALIPLFSISARQRSRPYLLVPLAGRRHQGKVHAERLRRGVAFRARHDPEMIDTNGLHLVQLNNKPLVLAALILVGSQIHARPVIDAREVLFAAIAVFETESVFRSRIFRPPAA